MHHQDDQFEKLIQDARTRVDNRLMKWSENIKKLVRYFCIKVNMKNRWFIYVYLKNQHMLYITMECLQSQPGIVLIFLLTQMKKKKIPVNQIMRSQLLHIIDRNVPEIHKNSFNVYFRMETTENIDKFGSVNLTETRATTRPGNIGLKPYI